MQTSNRVIYSDRLLHNIKALKALLPNGVLQMSVIKADAYGHGAADVCRILADHTYWFGVATMPEAMEIREQGVQNPILVFEPPTPQTAPYYQKLKLTAVVSHLDHFQILPGGTDAHLEFDTGMGRLGFLADEVDGSARYNHSLNITGIMTHFANADDRNSETVKMQQEQFRYIRSYFPDVPAHAANTGAMLYHQGCEYDMVRHGIGLFGYDPAGDGGFGLQPVMEWQSTVVQSKRIPKGWKVSYGSTWLAPHEGWLSIIPVGYADGLPRLLSNKLEIQIGEKWYPQVGNITMDYLMIFTGEEKIETGESVIILGGERNDAVQLAAKLDTIPYELLCRVHPKVKKTYTTGN